MKTIDYVIFILDRFPKGHIFTYSDFNTEVNNKEAVIKCLNRLATSGKINKLSKGKFYKPENSVFDNLQPSQYQIVKDLLEENGKIEGYITGYGAYNELGLTTQVSNTIQIGKNEIRPALKRGIYKISFIRQKNKINKDNIPLLKILDSIRFIKTIPDSNIDNSCTRLIAIIKKLTDNQLEWIIKLVLKYPPSSRALLGALIDKSRGEKKTNSIRKSLNPITVYKLSVSESVLPNAKSWNIL